MKLYPISGPPPEPDPPMTVKDLIDVLSEMPSDLPVWTDGGGDPYLAGPVTKVTIEEPPFRGARRLGHDEPAPERWVEIQ